MREGSRRTERLEHTMPTSRTARQSFVLDKDSLYHAFQQTASIKFVDFAHCWRESKFSLVLYGRRMRELREWLTGCYPVILSDLQQFHPMHRRVFALFLLYSLCFKQPLSQFIPVRITVTTLQQLDDVKKHALQHGHVDVLFVWHKLISSSAIQIVHTAPLFGPLQAKLNVRDECSVVEKKQASLKSLLVPPLNQLSHLHHKYESMKRALSLSNTAVRDNFDEEEDIFSKFREKLETDYTGSACGMIASGTKNADTEHSGESIGDKRRRLKNRSVSAKPT